MSGDTPGRLTDDFESYRPFANSEAGEWIFHDGDKGKIGGFHTPDGATIEMPGIEMNSMQSWWIMDNTDRSLEGLTSFGARSGNKYLAQQYITGGQPCDDWAISPEIHTGGQTISLYARSFYASEPESFEILWSEGSTDPADFIRVSTVDEVPGNWTRYEFGIPETAVRFAIRCVSDYKAMLFIDDVEYIPTAPSDLTLKGYNIYRDNTPLNATPVEDTRFTDSNLTVGKEYGYHVSAVYDRGESAACGPVAITTTSVGIIPGAAPVVSCTRGFLTIESPGGKITEVFSASGICHYRGTPAEDLRIPLPAGIYTVRTGARVTKINVR